MSFIKKIFNFKSDNISAAPVIVVSFLLLAGTVTFLDMDDRISESKLASVSSAEFAETVAETGDVTLIDVRTPEEFHSGHLPGALNIDHSSSDLVDSLSSLNKDSRYAIYCRSGRRSAEILGIMEQIGFNWVIDLSGGIEALVSDREAMDYFR